MPHARGLLIENVDLVLSPVHSPVNLALFNQFLHKQNHHARLAGKQVFNLVEGHVLGVTGVLKRSLDEVVRRGQIYKCLQFWEVFWVQSVVLN